MPWRPNVEKVMSFIDKQCMVGRDIMDQGAGTGRKHGQTQTIQKRGKLTRSPWCRVYCIKYKQRRDTVKKLLNQIQAISQVWLGVVAVSNTSICGRGGVGGRWKSTRKSKKKRLKEADEVSDMEAWKSMRSLIKPVGEDGMNSDLSEVNDELGIL